MRSLSELLKNHRVPGVRLNEVRTTCAKVATQLISFEVEPKKVKVKEGVVYFSVPSVIKSELHLREEEFKNLMKNLGVDVVAVR